MRPLISLFLFVSILLTIFLCALSHASNSKNREISADEKQKIVERISSLQKDIHSIHASVSQEKRLTVLKKPLHIEGTVMLAKPNMLRWEVSKPEKSLIVIDGETITMYYPEKKEAQVYALSENLIASNTISFFMAFMSGSFQDMEKKFNVTIFRNNNEIIFTLTPLSKMVSRYLSSVTIYYHEGTGIPNRFDMLTPKGDKTETKLTDIKINPKLKPETFKIILPEDVWIINKFEQNNTQ